MNRNSSQPVILPIRPIETSNQRPAIVPFSARGEVVRRSVHRRAIGHPRGADRNSPLGPMRERLLKMIIANEWDRSHGNRAS